MEISGYKGKRVLVTGASGFVGRHLTKRLLEAEAEVLCTDIVPFPGFAVTADARRAAPRFKTLDVRDEAAVQDLLRQEQVDVLFHLAAIANPRACKKDFDRAYKVNVDGTFHLLQHGENVGRFVFLSSSAVYGPPDHLPIDENHPRKGTDPYAITKIIAEDLCRTYVTNYGRKCEIIRNFNSFGPYQEPDYVIPSIIRQGLASHAIEIWNSDPVRDFSYVENTVEAILRIGRSTQNSVYNVGSGTGVRIGDLATMIAAKIDKSVTIRDLRKDVIGSPTLVAGVNRLRELGWAERVPLSVGIERTVEWFRQ
jgi:nucleoside-diphosphate-sugar epimerase